MSQSTTTRNGDIAEEKGSTPEQPERARESFGLNASLAHFHPLACLEALMR